MPWSAHQAAGRILGWAGVRVICSRTKAVLRTALQKPRRERDGSVRKVPADFIEKMQAYGEHLSSVNPWAVVLAAFTSALVAFWPRLTHRVPGPLIAILLTTVATAVFDLPVDTIATRFGSVPDSLPSPKLPSFEWSDLQTLFPAAWAIALLGGIESLLSAVVADGMIGSRHRSNMELVAQGIANVVSPLFGGIPATGAIARTATNVKNGGRTPIAGLTHTLTLLLIMLFFGRWAAHIPIATLAGILIVVSYHMSEWRTFLKLFNSPRSDVLVLIVTFALTVLVDLTVALEVGIVLAAFLFMHRMASLSSAGFVTKMMKEEVAPDDPNSIEQREVPDGVEVFEIYGAFFFGAASKCHEAMAQIEKPPKVLILRLREVNVIDATGLRTLEGIYDRCRHEGTQLLLSGVHAQPLIVMERSGFLERIGLDNTLPHIDDALDRAREILGLPRVAAVEPRVPVVARDRPQPKDATCPPTAPVGSP